VGAGEVAGSKIAENDLKLFISFIKYGSRATNACARRY